MAFKLSYPKICLIVFIIVFIFGAINPISRKDWLLESILSVLLVIILTLTYNKFKFSNMSYTLITIFLLIHTIGSHYTYSNVPFLNFLWTLTNSTRNHYDRIVHFLFGFLLYYPIRELIVRKTNIKGFLSYFLPFCVVASFSVLYEIIEWGAASIVSPELGAEYLGIQGDIWDAQKDSLLAIMGAISSIIISLFKKKS